MKKITTKLVALICSMIMVLAMATSVFAAADDSGYTIKITGGSGSYYAYQIFTGTYDATTKQLQNIKWGTGVKAVTDTTDNVAKVAGYAYTDRGAQEYANYLSTLVGGKTTGTTTVSEDSLARVEADKLAQSYLSTTRYESTTTGTGATAVTSFSNLPAGYYLIQNKTTGNTTGSTRFILQVIDSSLGGDSKTIEIAAKSTTIPVPEKKVVASDGTLADSTDANIGDTLTYVLTATIPDSYESYKLYHLVMTDTLPDGLTYTGLVSRASGATSSYEVYFTSADGKTTTYFEDSQYTPTTPTVKTAATDTTPTVYNDGGTLKVDFGNLKSISGIAAGTTITVKYTATLNSNAIIDGEGNENTLKLTYTNDPNYYGNGTPDNPTPPENWNNEPKKDTDEDEVVTYTYATAIQKVDENGVTLKGATFTVPFTVSGSNGEYTVTSTSGSSDVTTDDNGLLVIKGLKKGTYKVTEKEAPAGYNIIYDEITLTADTLVSTNVTTGTTKIFYNEKNEVVNIEKTSDGYAVKYVIDKTSLAPATVTVVENRSGSVLPSTGGMGTTLFYVVGMILVLGAGVVLVARKRISK